MTEIRMIKSNYLSLNNRKSCVNLYLIVFIYIVICFHECCAHNEKTNLKRNLRSPNTKNDEFIDFSYSNQDYINYVTYSELKNRMEVFPSSSIISQANANFYNNQTNEIVYNNQKVLENLIKKIDNFKEIAIDSNEELIYVGAKNYLIRLSFKNGKLTLNDFKNDIVLWKPNEELINECKRIMNERYCENYITIISLESFSNQTNEANAADRLLVCGTFANKPQCNWRNKHKISELIDSFDGIGKSPPSPDLNSIYLKLSNGDYYFATSIDYSEFGMKLDHLIDRSMGPSRQLRTDRYNSNWLNEPVFVGSIAIGNYVYFFIRETSIEFMNCGQRIYSRVVRICKHDQGLENYDLWRSFEKARLTCSIPGGYKSNFTSNTFNSYFYYSEPQYPFDFDEVQHVFHDTKKNLIYALFLTARNGMKGSAICVFDVESLEKAFNGPFKHQTSKNSIWESYDQPHENYKCEPGYKELHGSNKTKNIHYQRLQLKHLSVLPLYNKPILVVPNKRINKLIVDNVVTKHQNNVDVMFLSTEYNTILKYMIINEDYILTPTAPQKIEKHSPTVCLLEEIEIFDSTFKNFENSVNNLAILEKEKSNFERSSRHLLIATSFNIIMMSLSNCELQTNYFSCLSTMDPYCIWDSKAQKCLLIFNTNETVNGYSERSSISQSIKQNAFLHQHLINSCPLTSIPVDGGFGPWTVWTNCQTKSGEKCKCRMRLCNSPEPKNGGKNCDENASMEILDCEVNGGWTSWSSWSACKSTVSCDQLSQPNAPPLVRTRYRTCTNPEPKFNGRVCVGPDQEEQICTSEMIYPCSGSQMNQWSSWGAWDECSKSCGEGFQMRKRVCNGKNCVGCNQEWRVCNSEACKERIENLITEWETIQSNKESYQKLEKRFKFTCKYDNYFESNNLDGLELNTTSDYRICEDDKFCKTLTSINDLGVWSEWSDWSACKSCNDEQYRTRKCNIVNTCFGHDKETRTCSCNSNLHNEGWGCWSDFTECSNTCGKGFKKRTRKCMNQFFNCAGEDHEIVTCHSLNCSYSALIYLNIKSKSQTGNKNSKGLEICCCFKSSASSISSTCLKKRSKSINERQLSSSLDHNSLDTNTRATDVLHLQTGENGKYCSANSESSSNNSAASNQSKEYFTIGNRFDPSGLSSLLNDVIPDDDDDDDILNFGGASTLNRNSKKSSQKQTSVGLPNKSFNTYIQNHKDGNKNSNKNTSGISTYVNNTNTLVNNTIGSGINNISNTSAARYSNYSNLHNNGSIKSLKQQRTSFAFSMRTNLDQDL